MAWTIEFAPAADKQIDRLDATAQARILRTPRGNLARYASPRDVGEPLSGKLSGFWKYRIGGYRVIARIKDARFVVMVIQLGHRGGIYR